MGSAEEPEPPWGPSPACQPRIQVKRPKPRVPPKATTQPYSLNLPLLFDRPEPGRSPCLPSFASRAAKLPSCDRSGRVLPCVTGKFRPVTRRRGKPKTGATAAFLGELGYWREKAVGCCVNVTIPVRDPIMRLMNSAEATQFSTWSHSGLQPILHWLRVRPSGRSRLLAIGFEARIDQRDDLIDDRMAHALLLCDQLHQLVGTFDIRRAVLQRACRRRRPRQALRRGGVFLERHEVAR